MVNQNKSTKRVLSRTGARELTPEEIAQVSGGIGTTTVCSFDYETKQADGDIGEC
jgi:hypothetical protein